MIEIETVDNSQERLILMCLIVSDSFIPQFIPLYTDADYFSVPWSKTIADWCVKYYKKYEKAPGSDIQRIYNSHRKALTDENASMMEKFLLSLSEEYKRKDTMNVAYMVDMTVKYFKQRSLQLAADDLTYCLQEGKLEDAEDIISTYNIVEKTLDSSIDVMSNTDIIDRLYEDLPEPIIKYPGKYGKLINPLLKRDSFVAFMAPEKTGKSHYMDDLLMRGVCSRLNACLFEAGDMSDVQRMNRYLTYFSQRPVESYKAGEIMFPVLDCNYNQDNTCNRPERSCNVGIRIGEDNLPYDEQDKNYRPCTGCRDNRRGAFSGCVYLEPKKITPLTKKEALEAQAKYKKRVGSRVFKMAPYPNSTLTFDMINRQLDAWERNDSFIPDVIGIDYLDIMDTSHYGKEYRHQQNELWKQARKLSQQRHVLLISATQANAQSYFRPNKDKKDDPHGIIRRYHVAEDKRKLAHATGIIGLNQSPKDKVSCIIKANVVIQREGAYNEEDYACIMQCLSMGRPHLQSF